MHSLFIISPGSPVPVTGGWAMRYLNLAVALRARGELDVWLVNEAEPERAARLSAELGGARVHAVPPVHEEWTPRADLKFLFASRSPRWASIAREPVRREFREWVADRYDVALFADAFCFDLFGDLVNAPAIIDLGDVPDRMAAREMSLDVRRVGARVVLPRNLYRHVRSRVDVHRRRRMQQKLADAQIWRLTCSTDDQAYLGHDHVVVVPNGYERSGAAVGRNDVSVPPTILIQGSLQYEPNADGVGFFARDVLPRIRHEIPGTRLVAAGAVDQEVADSLSSLPGVECLGFVPRMEEVLADADLVAAPLRLGGGTRIKILEAFAHGVPVVATTVGAEGLAVRSGRELLIADSPEGLAEACLRLLRDRPLRADVTRNALALVERQYSWPRIRADFQRFVASEVCD